MTSWWFREESHVREHHHRPCKEANCQSPFWTARHSWGRFWGSLQKMNLSVEGACTPHREWSNSCSSKDFWGWKNRDFITHEETLSDILERRLHHRHRESFWAFFGGEFFTDIGSHFLGVLWRSANSHWKRQVNNYRSSSPPLKLVGSSMEFITVGVVHHHWSLLVRL